MPWNPDIYNQFKAIRYKPFYDLAGLIAGDSAKKAIDIGCGTGEQTYILSQKFKEADFTGIDASAEMLAKSGEWKSDRLHFKQQTIEAFVATGEKWDLIFSNSVLQWSDDHETLFPAIISLLNEEGEFAIQMPVQKENVLNQLLTKLAQEEPYLTQLDGFNRSSPVLSMDQYVTLMFENGLQDIQVMQKVYPIIANDHQTLFDFISGSALIPYLERLSAQEHDSFLKEFKARIARHFPALPAIYAFKRLLLYGRKRKS
ncbi:methyltransferase domain-containing protein [Terrimonas rubra]|uniref:Methyltransferase domain-containing protein n=1 Tax=Terrimonas rubra TaxID=1035890 RepID=A0ABW6A3U4_9BACT